MISPLRGNFQTRGQVQAFPNLLLHLPQQDRKLMPLFSHNIFAAVAPSCYFAVAFSPLHWPQAKPAWGHLHDAVDSPEAEGAMRKVNKAPVKK
jgi:hypothetical protein